MNVSVIIAVEEPTTGLAALLSALRYQTHALFEVVLVTGAADMPGADAAKLVALPHWTLSGAKNAGAAHAAGDVLAFLDADVVPDALWLRELLRGYASDQIAGVGGPLANSDDDDPCYTADRLGNRLDAVPPPYWAYQIPYADQFVCLHAGNTSFRRTHFLAAGGFDEDIGDQLGQTDLCLRLTDHGYLLQPSSRCIVYKIGRTVPLASDSALAESVRAKVRFGVRSANPLTARDEVLRQFRPDNDDLDRAVCEGIALAVRDRPPEPLAVEVSAFRSFPRLEPAGRKLTLAFTTAEFPPTAAAPWGRQTWYLARGLAGRGHDVHLFVAGDAIPHTNFEQGVWIHWTPDALALHQAVTRLSHTRHLDLLIASGCEASYCLRNPALSCALHLLPTLKTQLEDFPDFHRLPDCEDTLYREQLFLQSAHQVIVSAPGLFQRVRRHNGLPFAPVAVSECPLAVPDLADDFTPRPASSPRLLFAGALGRAHGSDLFLQAVLTLLREGFDFEALLTGDANTPSETGPSYRTLLEREGVCKRVRFTGALSENTYQQALTDSDVVCLPYRVDAAVVPCLEAQVFGKAVVASDLDGARDVLTDGLLFQPGDAAALTARLRELLLDAGLRDLLGRQGRTAYDIRFGYDGALDATLAAYNRIITARAETP